MQDILKTPSPPRSVEHPEKAHGKTDFCKHRNLMYNGKLRSGFNSAKPYDFLAAAALLEQHQSVWMPDVRDLATSQKNPIAFLEKFLTHLSPAQKTTPEKTVYYNSAHSYFSFKYFTIYFFKSKSQPQIAKAIQDRSWGKEYRLVNTFINLLYKYLWTKLQKS